MTTNRKTALLVGVLYLFGTCAGSWSGSVTYTILRDPNYLTTLAVNHTSMIIGILCWIGMSLALAMIPLLLYPILKNQHPVLAMGYIVVRGALESGIGLIMAINQLLLLLISQQTALVAQEQMTTIEILGMFILHSYTAINPVLIIAFSLGGLLLYCMLYQSHLIPRWLSIWGLIAISMHASTAFLILFEIIRPDDISTLVSINSPILFQEIVMAGWLILKGFNGLPIPAPSTPSVNTTA